MKTRKEVARFIESQIDYTHEGKFNTAKAHHYGLQEIWED